MMLQVSIFLSLAAFTNSCHSVLGNPGSGCSTFLRTIANDHASFLHVDGSLDYSGLSPREVARNFRSSVIYVPEDDTHLPNLTVQQTLDFALQNNTPKKWRHEIPRFLQVFARAFGMSHVMDTVVGNSFIRGVSGGERKRVSILESLASNSSVNAWDGSTRGLDASSALDYIRSLRILTDACERATIVSIYQASDAVYNLMDKVMLISQGRMLYQGPAADAEAYFNDLGYYRQPRQTMSDFLTTVSSGDLDGMPAALDVSVPKGAVNLEQAFRQSQAFKKVEADIQHYESGLAKNTTIKNNASQESVNSGSTVAEFKGRVAVTKSRFVSSRSSYTTSFFRQSVLCSRREFWYLRNHLAPLISKLVCVVVSAFLIGSMFYNMPNDTSGVYSRGGFSFYSSVLVAWFQIAELENSFADREVVTRQKRYAMVRPSAVVLGKTTYDLVTVVALAITYSLIAYFLSGMRREVSPQSSRYGSLNEES
jgi:ABC-type multidrug transport system ATPase subunit